MTKRSTSTTINLEFMRGKFYDIFLLLIVAIGLVASISNLSNRASFESSYRDLTIAVDYFQLHKFARHNGVEIEYLLDELKARGFDTIALLEDTPEFLEERNIASVAKGYNIEKRVIDGPESKEKKEKSKITHVSEDKIVSAALGLPANQVHIIFDKDYAFTQALYDSWEFRLGKNLVDFHEFEPFDVISLTGDPEVLYQLGAGFTTNLRQELIDKGFEIIPRLRNNRKLNGEKIKSILESEPVKDSIVIFEGDEILGFPAALGATADGLKSQNTIFGFVEFAKQDGDRSLGLRAEPAMVRVHSISDEEMMVYSTERAVSRFVRAARERSVRVIYIKPFLHHRAGDDLLKRNMDFFDNVRSSLSDAGFTIGEVSEHKWDDPGRMVQMLTLLAIIAGFALLIFWGWNIRSWFLLILLLALTVFISTKSPDSMFIKLFGMIAGFSFPILGVAKLFRLESFLKHKTNLLKAFFMIVFYTIIGALLVASLFSTSSYMLGMNAYSGVKLTLLIPIFLTAIIGVRLFFRREKTGFLNELIFFGDMEVRVKHLVILAIVGFAGLMILTRSGNEPIIAVSNLENVFRGMLEDFFAVRPRTKEFMIGHPLLILALFAHRKYARKLESLVFICLVGGIIGQISIFNTFCHFHTPLGISIVRTIYGLIAGLVIGLVLCIVLMIIMKLLSKVTSR